MRLESEQNYVKADEATEEHAHITTQWESVRKIAYSGNDPWNLSNPYGVFQQIQRDREQRDSERREEERRDSERRDEERRDEERREEERRDERREEERREEDERRARP